MPQTAGMDISQFWSLIERSKEESTTKNERRRRLEGYLAERPLEETLDFERWLLELHRRAASWDLFGAVSALLDIRTEDGFTNFLGWLIGLGGDSFESVVSHSDNLIDVPEIRRLLEKRRTAVERGVWPAWSNEEYPEFAELSYVAQDSYMRITGSDNESFWEAVEARGGVYSEFNPAGESWGAQQQEMKELKRRLPRIYQYVCQSGEYKSH